MRKSAALAYALLIQLLISGGGGCQTVNVQSSDGRPLPPDPVPAPRTPASASVHAIVLRLGPKPLDRDANGYPDTVQLEAYLFNQRYPSPKHEAGTFEFALHRAGPDRQNDPPIAEWSVPEGPHRLRTALLGLGYGIELNLHDAGGDAHPVTNAILTCSFTPADGSPAVKASGLYWLQIGRRDYARSDRAAQAAPRFGSDGSDGGTSAESP